MGLGIPFLLLALGSAKMVDAVGFLRKHSRTIQIIGGVAMVLVGLLLLTGAWNVFIAWARQLVVGYGATVL